MNVKELIEALKKHDQNAQVVITNDMGYPAFDYEGQEFNLGVKRGENGKVNITIRSEIE